MTKQPYTAQNVNRRKVNFYIMTICSIKQDMPAGAILGGRGRRGPFRFLLGSRLGLTSLNELV